MKIKGILMTNETNLYGHQTKVEELIIVAKQSKDRYLFRQHEPWKSPIGIITDTKIEYLEDKNCLAVTAEIQINDGKDKEVVLEMLEKGGFSSTYSDGGFIVDESDGAIVPGVEVYFDAYRTDETKLYLEALELSKVLNTRIQCIRIRRHAISQVLAFVGTTIGGYFLVKILDDIDIYTKFKQFLIGTSKSSEKGKETNINVIAPTETRIIKNRISYHITGQDNDIEAALDYLRDNKFIHHDIDSFKSQNRNTQHLYYDVKRENGKIIVYKTKSVDKNNKIDYYI